MNKPHSPYGNKEDDNIIKKWLRLINYESKPNEGKKVTELYKRYYKSKNKL